MTLLLMFLGRAWPYLLALAVIGGGYYWLEHIHCNVACHDARSERDELSAQILAARERATALALLWAKSVDDAETKEHQREAEATRRYDSLLARAQAVNRGSGLRLSVGTIGVLNDATREANAAGPPPEHQEPAEAVSGTTDEREIAIAWVKASEAYADAYGKWQACVQFYQGLQHAELASE